MHVVTGNWWPGCRILFAEEAGRTTEGNAVRAPLLMEAVDYPGDGRGRESSRRRNSEATAMATGATGEAEE